MPPFTAEITFTGICGIVPRQDPPTDPEAFCFVLPNAWRTAPSEREMSVDGFSRLRRHAAFATLGTQPLDTNHQRDLRGLWPLQGHRLVFKHEFPEGLDSPPAWDTTLGGLATFEDVANRSLLSVRNVVLNPTFMIIDPNDPKKTTLRTVLAAHAILSKGTLSSKNGAHEWVFDNYLRANPTPAFRRLNHEVTVTIKNLKSLTIERVKFGSTSPDASAMFTQDEVMDGTVFITVANLCDENPLRWGDLPAPDDTPDDDDFRWHYQVIDDPDALRAALAKIGGARCPIPRFTSDQAGGNGINCDPIRFPKVSFGIP
ncbi:MAG TPA: hypothetical protein VGS57_16745 [Thermoanaerobaculia bacterium]|jgi:hypothetical protein|nr:hypothetical protein [Thermoanaerobaculia bacterium]